MAEEGPATLDIDAATANVPTHEVSWNIYDRLITHGTKTLPDGTLSYDFTQFKPELAESWEIAPDGEVGHLPSAQGRHVSRRFAGHRRRREMVVRSRGFGRRISRESRWARAT